MVLEQQNIVIRIDHCEHSELVMLSTALKRGNLSLKDRNLFCMQSYALCQLLAGRDKMMMTKIQLQRIFSTE